MPEGLIAGIGQAVGGLVKGISGIGQRKQGKKLLKKIGDSPQQQMPEEIGQNVTDAGIDAATGMPSEQYNIAMRNIQRNQLFAMRNAAGRKGGLMALPTIMAGTNDAVGNLDATSAGMRLGNRRYLYGTRNTSANWKDKIWQTNVKNPWDLQYNYAMGLLGQGNYNLTSGISDFAAGGLGIYDSLRDSDSGKDKKG